ncbi:MAG: shikimate kinase [Leeuwenhoekiella sp.]
MNIILLGYMGSGKSTVGRILAGKLKLDFVDFDQFLEEKENMSIKDIFSRKGEIYFRKLEHKYLEEVLSITPRAVISLGGGTPCYGTNMELIKHKVKNSVYIKVGIEELTERLWNAREERPLLKHQDTREKMDEFVRKHLFERSFYYNQAAIKILVDGRSAIAVAQEIKLRLL